MLKKHKANKQKNQNTTTKSPNSSAAVQSYPTLCLPLLREDE